MANLEHIFGPLTSSTPTKLYRASNEILTSEWLDPYEFSIHEDPQELNEKDIATVENQETEGIEVKPLDADVEGEILEPETLAPKLEIDKKTAEFTPNAPESSIIPISAIPSPPHQSPPIQSTLVQAEDNTMHPSSDIYTSIPLACYGLLAPEAIPPDAFSEFDPDGLSDIPLSNILAKYLEGSEGPRNKCKPGNKLKPKMPNGPKRQKTPRIAKSSPSKSTELDRQSVAELYKKLLLACVPGPDPLDILNRRAVL